MTTTTAPAQLLEIAFGLAADVPADDTWLSAREQAVLDGLRMAKRRRDWRLGRWIAKQAAARIFPYGQIEIIAAADGAPELYVDGARTAHTISISHSNGHAMAVVARVPLRMGCDVELVEPRSREFIQCYFTPSEAALVHCAVAHEQPLFANLIWSAKESVLKGARVGLRFDTRRVQVALARGPGWQPFWADLDGTCWKGSWRLQQGWIHTIATVPL